MKIKGLFKNSVVHSEHRDKYMVLARALLEQALQCAIGTECAEEKEAAKLFIVSRDCERWCEIGNVPVDMYRALAGGLIEAQVQS